MCWGYRVVVVEPVSPFDKGFVVDGGYAKEMIDIEQNFDKNILGTVLYRYYYSLSYQKP